MLDELSHKKFQLTFSKSVLRFVALIGEFARLPHIVCMLSYTCHRIDPTDLFPMCRYEQSEMDLGYGLIEFHKFFHNI